MRGSVWHLVLAVGPARTAATCTVSPEERAESTQVIPARARSWRVSRCRMSIAIVPSARCRRLCPGDPAVPGARVDAAAPTSLRSLEVLILQFSVLL